MTLLEFRSRFKVGTKVTLVEWCGEAADCPMTVEHIKLHGIWFRDYFGDISILHWPTEDELTELEDGFKVTCGNEYVRYKWG